MYFYQTCVIGNAKEFFLWMKANGTSWKFRMLGRSDKHQRLKVCR